MTTEKPFSGLLGGVAEHIVQHIVDFLIGCDVIFVNDLIAVVPSGVRLHLLPEHIIEHTADFFVGGYPFIRIAPCAHSRSRSQSPPAPDFATVIACWMSQPSVVFLTVLSAKPTAET